MPNQQRKIGDGPVRVKALRSGQRSGSSWVTGVCRHAVPTLRSQRPITATTHIHQEVQPNRTLIPSPPRSSGVTIVGPTTAIATHTTSQNHCAQDGRDTIDTCCAPGPDIATVWTCPTPVYTHTERRCTNNTQSQGHLAVPPFGDPHVNKVTRSGQPSRNAAPATQTPWASPPCGEDTPDRRQIQIKEKEGVHQQRVLC